MLRLLVNRQNAEKRLHHHMFGKEWSYNVFRILSSHYFGSLKNLFLKILDAREPLQHIQKMELLHL